MRAPRAFFAGGFALWMAMGRGLGSPSHVAIQGVGEAREALEFTFRVDTPGLNASGDPESADVRVPGFESRERRPGAPDLPKNTVLIAIPPGVTPILEVRPGPEAFVPGIFPRAIERETVDRVVEGPDPSARKGVPFAVTESLGREVSVHDERVQDPEIYAGQDVFPRAIAWLGKVGVLRDQRYVEVHLAPVRYDPGLPGLRVTRSFEVTVRFEGDAGARSEPRTEARFEDVYRNAFVNYAQGTTFRLSATAPARPFDVVSGARESASLTTSARYRIRVRQNGIVRLDYATMSTTPFLTENLSTWKLTSRGVEVPLQIQDDGDGILEPGEWVQFYGQALDDEPKAVLNTDMPSTPDLYEARDFSDENIYFLTVEAGSRARMIARRRGARTSAPGTGEAGSRARMIARPSDPTNLRTPPLDFEAVAHAEVDNAWRPLGGNDPWYWLPTLCISVSSCSGNPPTSQTESVALPGLRLGTLPVRVVVRLRGSSDDAAVYPDHRTRVTLTNASSQTLATNDDNGTFDGRTIYTHDFSWSFPGAGAVATDPVNVKAEVLGSGALNQVIRDWIEVHYQRTFTASGDTLTFDVPDSDSEFVVSGLASPSPAIYELTGRVGGTGIVDAVRLTGAAVSGAGPYSVRFRVDNDPSLPDGTPRRFVVAGEGAVSVPATSDFQADTVSDLRDTSNQADLIVIAHPSVLESLPPNPPTGPLGQLLALRASQGITSKVVLIQDVQDEFNDGLAGPLAIKKFLQWVMSTTPGEGWAAPKPAYVLLLGDGSYDYKGGTASGNYVPTQILFKEDPSLGYYASDNLMADIDGDQIADLMVGRISARSVAEANVVLQKVVDYEQNPPAGNWRHNVLFLSDKGKSCNNEEALDFESINTESEAYMKRPPFTDRKLRYWSDFHPVCPYDASAASAMRNAVKAAVNGTDGFSDGAAIVQYSGHGNFDWWSDDAFFDDYVTPRDTESLANGGRLPWLMVHTCLTGGFHTTADHSMGEDWLKRSGGGAIAVFAPTALDFNYIGHEVVSVVWNDLFGRFKARDVATPVLDTLVDLCTQGSIEPCQHYTFLGDPTQKLVLPSVAPPGQLQASPGNARVDLSWSASATPSVVYDLYRATVPIPVNYDYGPPLASGMVGTTYADTNVTNTATYYYYVVARDAQGYESRWSNFNSDCAVHGPDCVTATPSNPNPPAPPTGVTVTDTERGGSLRVAWNPGLETDIKGYTIEIGTTSGGYTVFLDVARISSYTIVGLTNGATYYVAVTATNTSLHTSGLSAEASGVPTSVQGIKPPGFIQTLRLHKFGTDAVLEWNAVTTDIYGKPETVSTYEVYRGTTPDFFPSVANLIGTSVTPTYTDGGALAGPSYYYLVRAVDTAGNAGGLGEQLPDGISALRVVRAVSPPGNLVISWPAVTRDFSGGTIRIDHYAVYASASLFTRAQIRDGVVPLLTTVTGTSIQITPPVPNQYYSVLAVDARGNVSPF